MGKKKYTWPNTSTWHKLRTEECSEALESLVFAGGGPGKTSFVSELSKIQQVTQHPVSDIFYEFFFFKAASSHMLWLKHSAVCHQHSSGS